MEESVEAGKSVHGYMGDPLPKLTMIILRIGHSQIGTTSHFLLVEPSWTRQGQVGHVKPTRNEFQIISAGYAPPSVSCVYLAPMDGQSG